MTYHRYHHHYH